MGATASALRGFVWKECSRCMRVLPAGTKHFHKGSGTFGFRGWCRPCTTKQSVDYGRTPAGKARTKRAQSKPTRRLVNAARSRLIKSVNKAALDSKLWTHLKNGFEPGMSVANRGSEWDIDHVIPITAFDMQCPMQRAAANHHVNLQPLFKRDNIKKGNKHCRLLKEAYLAWYNKVVWTKHARIDSYFAAHA